MRCFVFSSPLLLLMMLLSAQHISAQTQPTGRIVSVSLDRDPVRIMYDLAGSAEEDYVVILYLQRENDPNSMVRLEKVSGDVGEGKFSGSRRMIDWDRNELQNPVSGARYQFALEFRKAGTGLPWYIYAGAAVVGGAVYLAVKPSPAPTPEVAVPAGIPMPPVR